jgi:hypothetical protein
MVGGLRDLKEGGLIMRTPIKLRKPPRLPWVDQYLYLPGAFVLCVGLPAEAFFRGQDKIGPWPVSTWVLIGLGFILMAIIERLALIIHEMRTIIQPIAYVFKDADAKDFSINLYDLGVMRARVRSALGISDEPD